MRIRVIDTETTGLPPDARMCQIGACDVVDGIVGRHYERFINPGIPIPPEASAIHNITDEDVSTEPPFDPAKLARGVDVFAAHNAEFDRQFFNPPGSTWICTLKAARRIWPDAPSHKNAVLRYWLKLPVDRGIADFAHSAGSDAYVTAHILAALMDAGTTVQDMIEWTTLPSLLPRVNFGKHKGAKWSEVPLDYLEWLKRQNPDADVKFTLEEEFRRRG